VETGLTQKSTPAVNWKRPQMAMTTVTSVVAGAKHRMRHLDVAVGLRSDQNKQSEDPIVDEESAELGGKDFREPELPQAVTEAGERRGAAPRNWISGQTDGREKVHAGGSKADTDAIPKRRDGPCEGGRAGDGQRENGPDRPGP